MNTPQHREAPGGAVVVGMDFSALSIAAAQWTARHIVESEDVVLAHAICVPEPPGFLKGLHPPIEPVIDAARRGAEARLREIASSLGLPRVWPEIHIGRPDEVLEKVVTAFRAELLVIGPHADRPGLGKLLGGTAERMARGLSTTMLLARGLPAGAPRSILVALEDSSLTDAVVHWAGRLARRTGAVVVAMHVVNPLFTGAVAVGAATGERRKAEAQLRERAEEWIAGKLAGSGLQGSAIEIAFGDPGFEILAAAEHLSADLVILGRNAPGRGRARDIGGTASLLLRSGTGPLMIVGSGR